MFICLFACLLAQGLTDEDAKKAQAELESQGCKAVAHQLNVKDQASVDKLRDFVKENYGGLDILVNNAGISFVVRDQTANSMCILIPIAWIMYECNFPLFGRLRS